MWAMIEDGRIVREFPRAVNLRVGDVNYPSTVFQNAVTLRNLGIMPVRRRQVASPGDTTMYRQTVVDTVLMDYVDRAVTWAPRDGADIARLSEVVRDFATVQLLGTARQLLRARADFEAKVDPSDDVAFKTTLQGLVTSAVTDISILPEDVNLPEAAQAVLDGVLWPDA